MSFSDKFEELDKQKHDRESFDCGEPELNAFIQFHAAKHMQAGISLTKVLAATERLDNQKQLICAFYTVAPSSICRETLPNQHSKKLPHYPVPVFLLAQLAVHKDFHGQGLGKICLINALEYLCNVNRHMRAYAVVVDCLTESAQRFYQKFGFEALTNQQGRTRLFLPMKTIEKLFLQR